MRRRSVLRTASHEAPSSRPPGLTARSIRIPEQWPGRDTSAFRGRLEVLVDLNQRLICVATYTHHL